VLLSFNLHHTHGHPSGTAEHLLRQRVTRQCIIVGGLLQMWMRCAMGRWGMREQQQQQQQRVFFFFPSQPKRAIDSQGSGGRQELQRPILTISVPFFTDTIEEVKRCQPMEVCQKFQDTKLFVSME